LPSRFVLKLNTCQSTDVCILILNDAAGWEDGLGRQKPPRQRRNQATAQKPAEGDERLAEGPWRGGQTVRAEAGKREAAGDWNASAGSPRAEQWQGWFPDKPQVFEIFTYFNQGSLNHPSNIYMRWYHPFWWVSLWKHVYENTFIIIRTGGQTHKEQLLIKIGNSSLLLRYNDRLVFIKAHDDS